jgi:cholesterol transport system auxiliary component
MRARILIALGAIVSAQLAGCTTSLFDSESPVPMNYVLASAPATTLSLPHTDVDVAVERPDAAPGLDSDRIAVLKGRQLDYYRGVRWGSPAPEVVQVLLVDSFEDQHIFRSVTREQSRVGSDYVLDLQLRDFQAEYSPGSAVPMIRVAAVVRLVRVPDRKLIATVTAESRAPAAEDRMEAVAAAFEKAADAVALDLLNQLAPVVATDAPALAALRGQK